GSAFPFDSGSELPGIGRRVIGRERAGRSAPPGPACADRPEESRREDRARTGGGLEREFDDEVARARVVRGRAQLAGPGEAPAEAEDGRGIPAQPDGHEGRALAPGAADPDVLDAREHVLEEVPVDVVVDPPGVEPAGEAEGECGADA